MEHGQPQVSGGDWAASAVVLLSAGQMAEAEALCRQVLAQEPGNDLAYSYLGAALLGQERPEDARQALIQALVAAPGSAEIYFNLGRVFLAAGHAATAAAALKRAAVLCPGSPDIALVLGHACGTGGDRNGAAHWFRRTIELAPDRLDGYLGLCDAMLASGWFEEAMSALDQALARGAGTPAVADLRRRLETRPCFPGLQGIHAPERQVYMSAAVDMLGASGRPVRILEIGTFMGASMITWARAIERLAGGSGEICCLDPWEDADSGQYGTTMAADLKSGAAYRIFRNAVRFIPPGVTVTELRGFSDRLLPTLAGQTFDIIYVDGCHLHPEVLHDLRACDGLLAQGGFMCGDDLEVQLHETDAAFAEAHARNDFMTEPKSGKFFHPGVTLGVGTFFGPVSVFGGFWIMQKTAGGYGPVQMRGRGLLPYHWPEDYVEKARQRVLGDGLLDEVL